MGMFKNNKQKLVRELRRISEYYSNDLSRDIKESHEELKSEYEENALIFPEFLDFVDQIKPKLDIRDAGKLEVLTKQLLKVQQTAKHGVDAMWDLSRNQRKNTSQNLREIEALEN
ncbi:MAG: hypothetical protein ITG00_08425 [Flavobacterium sp.]|nr:hypothetical protein [Flavobacterium sp.]